MNHDDGFAPYPGELPLGLKYYDSLGAVEYKLNWRGVGHRGLPDEGGTPDRQRYWATYRQAGLSVIYNSAFADEDVTIYAILVKN